jgi:ADP-ribosylglycohydrolase
LWHYELPVRATFGPERIQLIATAVAALLGDESLDGPGWGEVLNPTAEWCGALIRADAYGWACPGDPARAAVLARRDAWVTHRRTGVYAAGFVAAAVADALVADPTDRLRPLETGLAQLPPRSRLARAVRQALDAVAESGDWFEAYERVHSRFAGYTHCRIYQEIGTLAVSLRFAESVGHGIGLQVCMGNDTDSFGATAGALLGALLGPDAFDEQRWIAPFRDTVHLPLAMHHDTSLEHLAQRATALAGRLAR